jgi:uncharacterized protein (DUF1501 family)
MDRRVFMKSGAMAMVTMGLNPSFLRRTTYGMELPKAAKGKVLICIFQRGAADALNVVVPHGDASYYTLRPNIAIPRPSLAAGDNGALDLDGKFGLHPALRSLKPLYDRGLLAPIVAVGSPSSTRSHFDAQDYMESGTPDHKGTPDGWLNRYLAVAGTCEAGAACTPTPFRAVSLTPQMPRMLEGPSPVVAMNSLEEFTVRATGSQTDRIEALYRTGRADVIHATGSDTFEAVKMLRAANPQQYTAANGAQYPGTEFGRRLRQIAQLIKSNVGLEIAFADIGGWDTHVNQGGSTGQLANRLREFGDGVGALVADLGDRMGDVVILTMTEFGRTARENGNGGTDHGHAGSMFVIGGDVRGRDIHGRWPGLDVEQLNERRDLALTTDFRSVFGEIVSTHLGGRQMEKVFPGFTGASQQWLNVLRSSAGANAGARRG